ncbi:MAG: RNA polymerase sigma factor [Bryobacteraceae bacterium]
MTPEFAELYHRYAACVYRAALRVTGNASDAEDVLQTVFLRIWNHAGSIDAARSPEAYLKRAASNAAIDLLRQRASRAENAIDGGEWRHEAVGPPLEETLVLKERLRQALARLPAHDAELFVLRYVEGLSNIELADLFEMERGTVATRLHRIRHTLQEEVMR